MDEGGLRAKRRGLRPLSGKAWPDEGKEMEAKSAVSPAGKSPGKSPGRSPVKSPSKTGGESEEEDNAALESKVAGGYMLHDELDDDEQSEEGEQSEEEEEYEEEERQVRQGHEVPSPSDLDDIDMAEKQIEEMWQGKSNVLVAVRVRPMNSREEQASKNVVKVVDDRMVVVMDRTGDSPKKRQRQDVLRDKRSKEKRYAFDFAFGPETPTEKVYDSTTKFLIDGVIIGYNATVFAYGATGAGKTHTMLGGAASIDQIQHHGTDRAHSGIMVLTLCDLFNKINDNVRRSSGAAANAACAKRKRPANQQDEEDCLSNSVRSNSSGGDPFCESKLGGAEEKEKDDGTEDNKEDNKGEDGNGNNEEDEDAPESEANLGREEEPESLGRSYRVSCSFLEVYNEMIRDLLTPSSEYLDLREDPVKGPTVTGLSEVEASSAEDVMNLLRKGNARRTTEGTAANQASSRSHAVLQITVERRDNGINSQAVAVSNVTIGKLSLIDLAGSERAAVTQNRGIRLVEGANINRSLLALGNCINALREGGKGAFVPYRDSKLTRLLKDSLGGNCRTVMVAAVSPARNQIEETLNTLKYANRAKNIKTQAERNIHKVDYHVTEYVNLISRLKTEITSLRTQLKKPPTSLQQLQQQQLIQQQVKAHELTLQQQQQQQQQQQLLEQLLQQQKDKSGSSTKKLVEKQQMTLLREQVVLNFKERMQLCRSLIEIEAQNIANNSELEMHRLVIQRWDESMERRGQACAGGTRDGTGSPSDDEGEQDGGDEGTGAGAGESKSSESEDKSNRKTKGKNGQLSSVDEEDDDFAESKQQHRGASEPALEDEGGRKKKRPPSLVTEPPHLRAARTESQQLQRANLKNGQLKLDIERRLAENERASAALRNQMETRITTEERRELMELEYRIGMLELENMELERSRMLHRCSMQYKDMLIKRLLSQLEIRDSIIEEQRKTLDVNGVDVIEGVLDEQISGLESLHMLQSLPIGAPATPGTPTPRNLLLGGVMNRGMPLPMGSLRPASGPMYKQRFKPEEFPPKPQSLKSTSSLVTPSSDSPGTLSKQEASLPIADRAAAMGKVPEPDRSEDRMSTPEPKAKAKLSSIYGLASPATDRQMFPLHRLEEELQRIERNNPYTPPMMSVVARGNEFAQAAEDAAEPSDPSPGTDPSAEAGQSNEADGAQSAEQVESGPNLDADDEGGSGSSRSALKKKSVSGSAVDKERRRAQRRYQSAHSLLNPGQQKKSHPYLRQSYLLNSGSSSSRKSDKAKSRTSSMKIMSNVRTVSSIYAAPTAVASMPSSVFTTSSTTRPQVSHLDKQSLADKQQQSAQHEKLQQQQQQPAPQQPQQPKEPKEQQNSSWLQRMHRASKKLSNASSTSGSIQRHRQLFDPSEFEEEKTEGKQQEEASAVNNASASLSLPPIKFSGLPGASSNGGGNQNHSARAEDESKSSMEGPSSGSRYQQAQYSSAIAPAPPFSPVSPMTSEEKVDSGRSGMVEEPSSLSISTANVGTCSKRSPLPRGGDSARKSGALSRLNYKIASGAPFLETTRDSALESKVGGDDRETLELVDANSCDEADQATLANAAREQRKADKKERKKLERRWAELNFVLRKAVHSDQDVVRIRDAAERSLTFLDQLDRKAAELNVLRGTLSRLLLPYSEDTAAADQRANTPVTGDSPLDSVMDLQTRRSMVQDANELRSLVRVKIADDADLDQARTAVSEVRGFFEKVSAYATKRNASPFEVISSLKVR